MLSHAEFGGTIALTIEVVVMNAYGIGLAADSTLHYPPADGAPERVFSHVDKIFDLSYAGAPASIMVNGALQIQGKPLSALLNLYPARSFSTFQSLLDGLLEHLAKAFDPGQTERMSERAFIGMRVMDCVQWLGKNVSHVPAANRHRSGQQTSPSLASAMFNDEIPLRNDISIDEAEAWPAIIEGYAASRLDELNLALHHFLTTTKVTGLVLVGYEYDQIFPQLVEIGIHSHGSRIHFSVTKVQRIGSVQEALLLSFSMDDEVRAFRDGIHPAVVPTYFGDYVVTSETALNQSLLSVLDALQDAPIPDDEARTEVIKIASFAATEHVETWRKARQDFADELLRGLALFPTRMLPWVARVQVEHTILRAITRPEIPKVGSPVSVAVVSRESGFQLVSEEARFAIPRPRHSEHLLIP